MGKGSLFPVTHNLQILSHNHNLNAIAVGANGPIL